VAVRKATQIWSGLCLGGLWSLIVLAPAWETENSGRLITGFWTFVGITLVVLLPAWLTGVLAIAVAARQRSRPKRVLAATLVIAAGTTISFFVILLAAFIDAMSKFDVPY
jgi:hypothetical protein